METIALPDAFNIACSDAISVYFYTSNKEIAKQQILLNKNTFSFLQQGTKEVFFNNASYAINNKQFLLMKSGHCLMTEKLSDTENIYKSILFFFSNTHVLNFIKKYNISNYSSKKLYATYCFDYDNFISRFVESIVDISKLSKNTQQHILSTKFEEIMLYLIEHRGIDFLYSLLENESSQKFIQTIESNKLKKLTVKELAFLCNMSISTFKREFVKQFNNTPSKWFLEQRLNYAATLLKTKSKRPSEIYEEIGYENLSNFIQAFKIKFGVTPKQYQTT